VYDTVESKKRRTILKKLLSVILLGVALFTFAIQRPALAADAQAGAAVFSANCAACHMGGKNMVNPAKTLSKADLEKYAMLSSEAIVTQATNGKNAMPAFGGRLSDEDLANVAAYILDKADKGW
jgi:cytochrome c6